VCSNVIGMYVTNHGMRVNNLGPTVGRVVQHHRNPLPKRIGAQNATAAGTTRGRGGARRKKGSSRALAKFHVPGGIFNL
jgi:hypothetical protein